MPDSSFIYHADISAILILKKVIRCHKRFALNTELSVVNSQPDRILVCSGPLDTMLEVGGYDYEITRFHFKLTDIFIVFRGLTDKYH